MKKALGGRAVLRKLPRLLKGMLLMLCLLSVSLSEVQADLWEQKRSMEMENTSIGEKSVLSPVNMRGLARSGANEIQQQKTVSGRIVDEQGEPVIGANVVEKGTTNGTVTDADGRFSLSVVPNGVLHVSYIGYLDEEVQVSGRTSVNITLREDTQSLEEVVVVAYGTSKRSVFTGSAASVDHAKLQSPNASFDKSLQGQVAGLQVMSASGQPGSTSSFRIRGSGSLNASNEPLYVVDGVPISANTKYSKLAEDNSNSFSILATLNSQDIESVTVLKDASAASLYGSRAANGVVLITTKNGKLGKASVSFHTQFGLASVPKAYDMMSSAEFYRMKWLSHYEQKREAGESPEKAAVSANAFAQGAITFNPYNVDQPIDANGNLVNGARIIVDTDWQDEIFKTALTQDYNVNVHGGNEKTNYFFSAGYYDQEGVTPSALYKRYSGKGTISTDVASWLKAGMNITFSHSIQHSEVGGGAGASPLYNALLFPNGVPVYLTDRDGNPILDSSGNKQYNFTNPTSLDFNPIAIPQMDLNRSKNYRFLASAFLDFKLYEGLNFKTVFAPDYIHYSESRYWNKEHGNGPAYNGRADRYHTTDLVYTFTNTLNYTNRFAERHLLINAMAGFEYWQSDYERVEAGATTFPLNNMYELSSGASALSPQSKSTKETLISYFGRVEYTYSDRYNFSVSLRSDGSSIFGVDNKWGTFWSAGASWRIEQEDLMKSFEWLDQLKLRLSYGTSGNNQGLDRYQSLGLWDSSSDYIYGTSSGTGHTQLANPHLKWEKQAMFNVGVDFRFLNRFYGSAEYFYKSSKDLLYKYPLAASNGFESIMMNMAKVANYGVELTLGAHVLRDSPLKWNIDFNLSAIRDEIKDLVGDDQIISNTKKIWSKGYSQYEFYMPTWAGVNPVNGDPQWVKIDASGSRGTTNVYSQATYEKQGRATPDFYGGLSTNLSYRGFDLSVLFAYSWGGLVYDALYAQIMHDGNQAGAQMHKDELKAWTSSNTNTNVPKYVNNNTNASDGVSTRFLYDATNIKLKNVTLSYTLPSGLKPVSDVLKGARIFVSADNLFTWFKDDWKGYSDIDIFGIGGYNTLTAIPVPTTLTMGFNLTF
ncbi:SusC/RagA family TonB-linked outer membrane protein [Tannerella forsythia]